MEQGAFRDWLFEEAEEAFKRNAVPLPKGAADELDTADAEGWPARIEGELAGRDFARRFLREVGAEWEPLEEALALRLLACSACDVPAVIAAMEKGEPFRTPFAEYRLVTG